MKIKKSEGNLTLFLNKKFYNEQAVDSAISCFSKACPVTGSRNPSYNLVSFSGLPPEDLNDIAMEFANYTLFLMKSRK
jgi:hypothetical protein